MPALPKKRNVFNLDEFSKRFEDGGAGDEAGYDSEEYDEDVAGEIPIGQQGLLPSVRDPKLWMVKCKVQQHTHILKLTSIQVGKERDIALAIMNKFLDKEGAEDQTQRLMIKSVVCPDHLKGHIYVEAEKDSHVRDAIKGVRDLFQWNLMIVPIKEMVDVLAVAKKVVTLNKGDWVRVKRQTYKGDIAQVLAYDEGTGKTTIKIVPRISMPTEIGKDDSDEKRKRKTRPPARFFNPEEIQQMKLPMDSRREPITGERCYYYDNSYFTDGFLIKTLNIKSLDTYEVMPTFDELEKFKERKEKRDDDDDEVDLQPETVSLPVIQSKIKTVFSKGDLVRVVKGDLLNLQGVVEAVEDDDVFIMPKHQDLQELLKFPSDHLQKSFKQGDHCKVINGDLEGETGLILKVKLTKPLR